MQKNKPLHLPEERPAPHREMSADSMFVFSQKRLKTLNGNAQFRAKRRVEASAQPFKLR